MRATHSFVVALKGEFPHLYPMTGRILFVDDEIEMCFMISNLLRRHGWEVMTAENAEVALHMADGAPLSVIILDVNLSGENGLKLMTFLHKNHPDVPIILYTGMDHDDEVVKKALREGARQYLRKGAPVDELIQAVQSVLNR
jgi:DNA-binding response OmpR family regulator